MFCINSDMEIKAAMINFNYSPTGYSVREARLGLRASGGNLSEASIFLQRREEERNERKRKEREEEERKSKRKKLGKTASGQWVNLGYLETIVEMGFAQCNYTCHHQSSENFALS